MRLSAIKFKARVSDCVGVCVDGHTASLECTRAVERNEQQSASAF